MTDYGAELISDDLMSAMSKIGINERFGLLFHFPRKYNDYRKPDQNLNAAMQAGKVEKDPIYLRVKLLTKPQIKDVSKPGRKLPPMVKAQVTDGVSTFWISRFGNSMPWRWLKEGAYIHVSGTLGMDDFSGTYTVKNPDLIPTQFQGKIAPEYTGRGKDFSSDDLATAVDMAVSLYLRDAERYICQSLGMSPAEIAKHVSPVFETVGEIIEEMHRPKSGKRLNAAREAIRLINAMHAVNLIKDEHERPSHDRSTIYYDQNDIKEVLKSIPFEMTNEQKRCVWNITKQLISKKPMDHLIYGDVGCGKTVSYLIPAICAQRAGKQVVIVTPNSLLSKQIYENFIEYGNGAPGHLVIQGVKKKDLESIDMSQKPVLIGTSAVINFMAKREEKGEHSGAELVIFDEQQKLGIKQKDSLIKPFTNVVEATATPVPRTVAQSVYGDKSVSYIEEAPVKKEITTKIVDVADRKPVFEHLQQIIAEGDQVAIICPNRKQNHVWCNMRLTSELDDADLLKKLKAAKLMDIELVKSSGKNREIKFRQSLARAFDSKEDANSNIEDVNVTFFEEINGKENDREAVRNAESLAQKWIDRYPGQVVLIHGGMTSNEKLEAMKEALKETCSVVITTSLVEVGLTFPRLRGVLVQEADKMGISTLHQIRGRLARLGGIGTFYQGLPQSVANTNEKTIDRLEALVQETRGSRLAEIDMVQRGIGDLRKSGILQAGQCSGLFPTLKVLPVDLQAYMQLSMESIRKTNESNSQSIAA